MNCELLSEILIFYIVDFDTWNESAAITKAQNGGVNLEQ